MATITGSLHVSLAPVAPTNNGKASKKGKLAVTLPRLQVAMFSHPVFGTLEITLPEITVSGSGETPADVRGSLSISLPHVTTSSTGTDAAPITGILDITLPHITESLVGQAVVHINGTLGITLPKVHAAFSDGGLEVRGTLAITLPHVETDPEGTVGGSGGGAGALTGELSLTLKKPIVNISGFVNLANVKGIITVYSKGVYEQGGTLLLFTGPANRAIVWEIVSGGGTVTPFQEYTDKDGRAFAKYESGTFTGVAKVGVQYVP